MSLRYFQSANLTHFLHQVIEVVSNYKNKSVKGFIWTSKKHQLNLDGRHETKKNIYRIVFSFVRVFLSVFKERGGGGLIQTWWRKKEISFFIRPKKHEMKKIVPATILYKKKLSQLLYIYFSAEQIQILITFKIQSVDTWNVKVMKIEYGVHV